MIRIFRNIGRGKEEGEKSGNFWTFVIGEFFLVFLGILIALQVDNWNQNRKERKMERVLLSEMLTDLNGRMQAVLFHHMHPWPEYPFRAQSVSSGLSRQRFSRERDHHHGPPDCRRLKLPVTGSCQRW